MVAKDALEDAIVGDCAGGYGIQGRINHDNSVNSQNRAFRNSEWLI